MVLLAACLPSLTPRASSAAHTPLATAQHTCVYRCRSSRSRRNSNRDGGRCGQQHFAIWAHKQHAACDTTSSQTTLLFDTVSSSIQMRRLHVDLLPFAANKLVHLVLGINSQDEVFAAGCDVLRLSHTLLANKVHKKSTDRALLPHPFVADHAISNVLQSHSLAKQQSKHTFSLTCHISPSADSATVSPPPGSWLHVPCTSGS